MAAGLQALCRNTRSHAAVTNFGVLTQNLREDYATLSRIVSQSEISRGELRQVLAPILRRWLLDGELSKYYQETRQSLRIQSEHAGYSYVSPNYSGIAIGFGSLRFGNIEVQEFQFEEVIDEGGKSSLEKHAESDLKLKHFLNRPVIVSRWSGETTLLKIDRETIIKFASNALGGTHSDWALGKDKVTKKFEHEFDRMMGISFARWSNGAFGLLYSVMMPGNPEVEYLAVRMIEGEKNEPDQIVHKWELPFFYLLSIASDIVNSETIKNIFGVSHYGRKI